MANKSLFHVSDCGDIQTFIPRVSPQYSCGITEPVVWAIDAAHLANYLLPRDCPRVAFRAAVDTTDDDRDKFLSATSQAVVAIEAAWFGHVLTSTLYVYEFSSSGFGCVDESAGYFISKEIVSPVCVIHVTDIFSALLAQGVELRVLPNLQHLARSVSASTLVFSCIRMRNAADVAHAK